MTDRPQNGGQAIDTTGVGPPWLHKHSSEVVEGGGAILIRGGLIDSPQWPSLVENIDDWRLDLNRWRWERLTKRAWPRFIFVRADGARNHLYWLHDYRRAQSSIRADRFSDRRAERLHGLGEPPRLDLIDTLYAPDVAHTKVPEIEHEFRVRRVSVDGVTVRYVEGDHDVRLTIEGCLPPETVEQLRTDLLGKLEMIENTSIICTALMLD